MRTPLAVLWPTVRREAEKYPVFNYFEKPDLRTLRQVLPSSSEHKERQQVEQAIGIVARLLWAEKIVEPLTDREAFASHLMTLTAAQAHLAQDDRIADTDTRRRRLACWLWCATLSVHPSRLHDPPGLAREVGELTEWLRGATTVPDVVANAREHPPTIDQLFRERSRKGRLFRCIEVQLYQRNVRDLHTGEPIEVGLHFGERPHVDHIFAKAWCRDQPDPPDPSWVDSIVNKTVLAPYTNMNKSAVAPSELLHALIRRGIERDRLLEFLEGHLVSVKALEDDDFSAFMVDRASRLVDLLHGALGLKV